MYFNTLIIMNEDTSGYGNRSRKPSGYCKLAMPNKIICYAQGLKQLPKGQVYRLYLTSKSKDQCVEIGMFQVGISGNKETRWLMDPSNINNSDINAKEIDGALIKVDGDNVEDQIVPLVGFSAEPYGWEHLLKLEKTEEKLEPPKTDATEATPIQTSETGVEQAAEVELAKSETIKAEPESEQPPEKPQAEPIPQVSMRCEKDEILALKAEIEKLNRTIQESKEIIERLEKTQQDHNGQAGQRTEGVRPSGDKEEIDKVTGINEYINNFIRKFQAADKADYKTEPSQAEGVFEMRIPINPFEVRDTGIKWVRITHDDLASFPSLDHEWINQPFVMDAHRDYKHFILGKDESDLTYYLGIPGIFDPNKDSGLNIDRIEKFSCCHNVAPRNGEAGYWIARI